MATEVLPLKCPEMIPSNSSGTLHHAHASCGWHMIQVSEASVQGWHEGKQPADLLALVIRWLHHAHSRLAWGNF